jgi:hypothetical protein
MDDDTAAHLDGDGVGSGDGVVRGIGNGRTLPRPIDMLWLSHPIGAGGWIVVCRLGRSSGFEPLASDLCLEGRADRLVEPSRILGGLLLAFLSDERIALL